MGLWCIEHDIPVPHFKILEDDLTAKQATEKEKEYWYKYRDDGWNVLKDIKSH